ncbi:MAG: hypothetical protein GX446_15100 [Chthonomonadales bacterium]|nr:hypothetical protein [Chthonomonadales bacterium]
MRMLFAVAAIVVSTGGREPSDPRNITLRSPGCFVEFDGRSGAILAIAQAGRKQALLWSGPEGLWRARLRDGSTVVSSSYGGADSTRTMRVRSSRADAATLAFTGPDLDVTVEARVRDAALDLSATVRPKRADLIALELPAQLRFDAGRVRRFIAPADGNQSVGVEFNRRFFMPQSADNPGSWEPKVVGPRGYARLYPPALDQRADLDPPVPLHVTDEGRAWLGDASERIEQAQAVVNRPPKQAPNLTTLAASANGAWLSAAAIGEGRLWRIGGAVGPQEAPLVRAALEKVIRRLLGEAPPARRRVCLLAMQRAPDRGGWSGLSVQEWERMLAGMGELVTVANPTQMAEVLRSDRCAVIVNPYGEWCPALPDSDMDATVDAIAAYVRRGGNWIETGGYPFFYALQPVRHYRYGGRYPAMFADFMHLDSETGSASVYRVQPLNAEPWSGAAHLDRIFVPGELACGSDERGGFLERSYAPLAPAGSVWRSPITRIVLGRSAERSLSEYCIANGITRTLAQKMKPDLLARFRQSVLLYYAGNASAQLAGLDMLPRPTLIHFADYLKGGFDKEYPDHLPPSPGYGTLEDLQKVARRCRELGLLWMPYTNPTWWCDNPRGPTFVRAGEAPLVRGLDGKPIYERYGPNDGWTICFWHPEVRRANRETVRQFTRDVPVDILFQDQCGARSWHYDTNPASPTGHAYIEGLLSMVAEDSRQVSLSTESGWDRVAQFESQLCGMTWALVPTEYAPEWRRLMRDTFPPETWTVYPLAQRIAHDKAAMAHHDLGQFVTNDEALSWTLALGFGLSYRAHADALRAGTPQMEWLRWLDRIQKTVCARYVGAGLRSFRHERPAQSTDTPDDGIIEAQYGNVQIIGNLGPSVRTVKGKTLAPHGFFASGPGLAAGRLSAMGGMRFEGAPCAFVASLRPSGKAADVWFYGPAGRTVAAYLPAKIGGKVSVRVGDRTERAAVSEGVIRVPLPADDRSKEPRLAHAVVTWR